MTVYPLTITLGGAFLQMQSCTRNGIGAKVTTITFERVRSAACRGCVASMHGLLKGLQLAWGVGQESLGDFAEQRTVTANGSQCLRPIDQIVGWD